MEYRDSDELSFEELQNVVGGTEKREVAEDIALKNEHLFRKEQIQNLKRQRELLEKEREMAATSSEEHTHISGRSHR